MVEVRPQGGMGGAVAPGLTLIGILVAVTALYASTLGGGPLADDLRRFAEQGPLWTELRWFFEPLPGVAPPLPADVQPRLYRPLWRLSFALDAAFFGGWWSGSRVVNLGLHLVVVTLFAGLTGALKLRGPGRWLAVALFALFPTHVEAVCWVSARGGPLALALVLGAWQLEARGQRFLAAWCLLGAMGTKETALVAPFVFWALTWAGGGSLWAAGRRSAWGFGVLAAALAIRWWILGEPVGGFGDLPWGGPLDLGWWTGLAGTVVALLAPVRGVEVGEGVPWAVALVVGVLLVGAASRRPARSLWRVSVVGLIWVGLALVPHYKLFVSPDTHEHDRFLYDAVAGLSLVFGVAVSGWSAGWRRWVGWGLVGLVGLVALGRVADRRALQRESASLRAALAEEAGAVTGPTVFWIPATVDGGQLGRNLCPWTWLPPWQRTAPGHEVGCAVIEDGGATDWLGEPPTVTPRSLRWAGPGAGFVPGSGG